MLKRSRVQMMGSRSSLGTSSASEEAAQLAREQHYAKAEALKD